MEAATQEPPRVQGLAQSEPTSPAGLADAIACESVRASAERVEAWAASRASAPPEEELKHIAEQPPVVALRRDARRAPPELALTASPLLSKPQRGPQRQPPFPDRYPASTSPMGSRPSQGPTRQGPCQRGTKLRLRRWAPRLQSRRGQPP